MVAREQVETIPERTFSLEICKRVGLVMVSIPPKEVVKLDWSGDWGTIIVSKRLTVRTTIVISQLSWKTRSGTEAR